MQTFDLAGELDPTEVTVNCLHPGTMMPTKMVLSGGGRTVDTLETGVDATVHLIADPALDGVSGRYFDIRAEARAREQAYDLDARRRLRELTERLVGLAPVT